MELNFRFATIRELDIYFKWANDPLVRNYSFDNKPVPLDKHVEWFKSKLLSAECFLYFFTSDFVPAGQVRIERSAEEIIIGISVDEQFRGRSLSSRILTQASDDFSKTHPGEKITAYIKTENQASYKSFLRAGFSELEIVHVNGIKSYKLIK